MIDLEQYNMVDLIPQRPPFVFVDKLIESSEHTSCTRFTVEASTPFVRQSRLQEAGLLENIAQTCAARIGYLNLKKGISKGVVAAANHFVITRCPRVGETLHTTITIIAEVFDMLAVEAVVRSEDEILATCNLKVKLINN